MTYLLIGVSGGRVRVSEVDSPRVPDGLVGPGEVAFVVEALDVQHMQTNPSETIPVRGTRF